MAFKKGVLTESDIRVIDSHSKKNLSDSTRDADPAAIVQNRKRPEDPAEKS